MVDERTLSALVGDVYDVALDADRWLPFLEKLGDLVHGLAPVLAIHDLRSQHGSLEFTRGFEPTFRHSYGEYYAQKNVWLRGGRHLLTPGRVRTSHMMCSREELLRSEFYNDFLKPQRMSQGIGGTILKSGSLTVNITIMRPIGAPDFGPHEIEILEALMPHLQRAASLQHRFAGLEVKEKVAAEALDRLTTGVILVGERGRVLLANRMAAEILREDGGLSVEAGELRASLHQETTALRAMIDGASRTSKGGAMHPGGVMHVSRSDGKRPLAVVVAPVGTPSSILDTDRPLAMVFVSDPDRSPEPIDEALKRLYGLTRAEARIAMMLLDGKTIDEMANASCISRHTARTHLKRILAKTGTRRQSDLVRLLMAGVAPVRF